MTPSTMARSSGSTSMSRTKDWSILRVWAGRRLKADERRVAGARSRRGRSDAESQAAGDDAADVLDILEGGGFDDFEFEVAGRDVGVGGEQGLQAVGEIRRLELAGSDIDAHRQVDAQPAPAAHLGQGRGGHPFADFDGEIAVVDDRQELVRRHQAPLRRLPADQRLGADHPAAAHVDLGLVVEDEFAGRQGGAQAGELLAVGRASAVVVGIEENEAIAAGLLGDVHGLVGIAQQAVGIGAVVGKRATPMLAESSMGGP